MSEEIAAQPFNNKFSFLSVKESNIPTSEQSADTNKKIVRWGKKNDYPYFLNYLYNNNPIHSGIIRSKVFFTVSGGLKYDGADLDAWKYFYDNRKHDLGDKNLDDLCHQNISPDFEKSNIICLRLVFTKLGERKLRKLEAIPFESFRFQVEKTKEGADVLTGKIGVSPDWLDNQPSITWLSPYNQADDKQRECFLLYMEESSTSLIDADSKQTNPAVYPEPPYAGAITAIDSGIQILRHNSSELYNGFAIGTVVYLANGAPKNEGERRDLEKDLAASTTGPYQRGRIMVVFGNGPDGKPEVLQLNGNNLPDRYLNAKKSVEESIIHGHSVTTPILFGVKTEGSLGNATELEAGYAIMQANYFTARRNAILSVLNFIGRKHAGLKGNISFNDVVLSFEQNVVDDENAASKALNAMSPLVANQLLQVMTINEKRSLGKLPPIDGGDVLPTDAPTAMKMGADDHEKIMKRFATFGRPASEFTPLYSMKLVDGTEAGETALLKEFKNEFATLSEINQQVLGLINSGEDFDAIKSALDISGQKLSKIYKALIKAGLITSDGAVTDEGLKAVAANELENLEILYEYRLRPDAPALVGPESREFCRKLLKLNRLYTREEIGQISGAEGYDVFAYRGGWYHNPEKDINEPGCRHEWAQVVTFKQ